MRIGDRVWNIFYLTDKLDLPYRWVANGPWTVEAYIINRKEPMYLLRFRKYTEQTPSCELNDDINKIRYDYECHPSRMFKTKKQALKECKKRNEFLTKN